MGVETGYVRCNQTVFLMNMCEIFYGFNILLRAGIMTL